MTDLLPLAEPLPPVSGKNVDHLGLGDASARVPEHGLVPGEHVSGKKCSTLRALNWSVVGTGSLTGTGVRQRWFADGSTGISAIRWCRR